MIQLGEHFRHDDQSRHSEWLRHRQWFIKARRDHARKEDMADKQAEEILAFAAEAVVATQIQIIQFETKLDTYDEATVIALMENQEMLDAVRAEIQDMLARAYVMDDGRRVFKSEDGAIVIDEFGEVVSSEELDPNLVPSGGTTPREYLGRLRLESDILADRQKIHDFDDLKNQKREEISKGEITEQRLNEMDAELLDAMPASVKIHVPEVNKVESALTAKPAFSAEANSESPSKLLTVVANKIAPAYDPMG